MVSAGVHADRDGMRVSGLCVAIVSLLVAAHPILVSRASADDNDTCNRASVPASERLAACTREINSGLLQDADLSIAYLFRGVAYATSDDVERALADYNEAIRLDPRNVLAYTRRAGVYLRRGDFDTAIADYSEVIQIEPGLAFGF